MSPSDAPETAVSRGDAPVNYTCSQRARDGKPGSRSTAHRKARHRVRDLSIAATEWNRGIHRGSDRTWRSNRPVAATGLGRHSFEGATMTIGMAGMGRMGANMARRLRKAQMEVVAYNRTPAVTQALAQEIGVAAAASLADMVARLTPPRLVWLMLPSGQVTEDAVEELAALLGRGDVVVDGGNSFYKDSLRRAQKLSERGIQFVDAGVSGGIWGLAEGYCLMVGGPKEALDRVKPYLRALAPSPDTGWLHCGPVGSGHFVKMVHNGIEYGMMQSLAEGLSLLAARKEFDLDLGAVAELWRHGSVVRSWLLDLTADFLRTDQRLGEIEPYVSDSGEGRWTALEAVELGIPTPVMSLALMMRFASQGANDYTAKLLAMMRKGFGGHAVREEGTP
ncbi:MAG: decarboxylating 6-phosphogluconate dehydrogenase [Betaproteobacteria bacterium]|nr:decarboxylating 6-phosphogluconate dehydrogenase [Betaproteobacteria bacterium]